MHGNTQGLFREVALERMASPERLDELMHVTTPMGWISAIAFSTVIIVVVGWGILGSVPTVVKGQGVLIRDGAVRTVDAPASGEVRELYVRPGDDIAQDQVIARVLQADRRVALVTSNYNGRVLDVRVTVGNVITTGAPIVSLERPGYPLGATLYLQPMDGKKVRPGMQVMLSPSSVRKEEFGSLLGQVTSVSAYPATTAGMRGVLGSDELAKSLAAQGAPTEIQVELTHNPETISGYQWTSTVGSVGSLIGRAVPAPLSAVLPLGWRTPPGPPVTIESGTICLAEVITEQQAPMYLVLAKFNNQPTATATPAPVS